MPKLILQIILILLGIYVLICLLLYFNQEKFIFHPTKVPKDFKYDFSQPFREIYFTASDSTQIHSLYFEVENPKGVVYYLHGNSGDLSEWGVVADEYLDLGYNVLMIDYRGFGKSGGKIHNEKHFYEDAQLGYDFLKEIFEENKIVIVGYSVGTGTASYLASTNHPKLLILQSPYYNLTDIMKMRVPFTPIALLKYKFDNATNITKTQCPVYIFHGDSDLTISYHNSVKLKQHLKEKDEYTTFENFGHNAMGEHPEYLRKLKILLSFPENGNKIIQNPIKAKFEDYAAEVYNGKFGELDFTNNPYSNDAEYIDFIKTEAKKTPVNFAGHYTIIQKSCGMDCEYIIAVINRNDGKVYNNSQIVNENCNLKFNADSKLLIVNSNVFVDESLNEYHQSWCVPEFYIWEDNLFKLISK